MFRENPRHVSWNNKNTEVEGGRQNKMGFSCRKVEEHTPHLILLWIWNYFGDNIYGLQFYRTRLSGWLGWWRLGISGISQLICLLRNTFHCKLFRSASRNRSAKVLDFQFLKVMNVRLSLRLCKILVQFLTFRLFSGHIGIYFTQPSAAVLVV